MTSHQNLQLLVQLEQHNIALLFANYLATLGISAKVVSESQQAHMVYCQEDKLSQAKAEFDVFIKAPFDQKYQQVELDLWHKILDMAIQGRRTGLGITAEGDLIAAIGYKYGTPEATLFSEKLHQLIATASYESSIELAEERGALRSVMCNSAFTMETLTKIRGKARQQHDTCPFCDQGVCDDEDHMFWKCPAHEQMRRETLEKYTNQELEELHA